MSGRSKNGRRLFRAAVRLHAYAAVRTNLSPYRAVFEAFLRLIYRIRQVPVCTQPPYYPPFALEVPAATAAGIFHFRRAAPFCRFPVVFPSPSGCFPAAFRLSFRHPLVAFPLPFHRRPACFSCDFRLPFRRLPVASPPLSGCHSDTFRLSSRLPSRRCPVAAFLNLCRRFRDADIVTFSGNPVARQNKLPGKPFGFPAECSGQPDSRPAGDPTKSSSPNPDCCIPR